MKIFLNIIGSIAVLLAILGIFLPLLPTTPFLLLASACYLRGSERMHRWLLNNRVFGSYIRNFEEHRAMPRRAKVIALLLMWASLFWSIYVVRSMPGKVLLATIGVAVTLYLLRLKTRDVALEAVKPPADKVL